MQRRPLSHIVYLVTIAIKGADGILETILGLLIAVAGPERFYFLVLHVTTPELENSPHSRTAAAVQHGAAGLAHTAPGFAIFYLLAHGFLKSGIAICLLSGRRWIFAPACVVLSGFIVYMVYRAVSHHFSWWLFGFAAFDLFTLILVFNEWRNTARGRA
jgi:uncharacterized membrane protein